MTLIERAEAACRPCGPCDGGLPMGCNCDPEPRAVIAALLSEVERGRALRAAVEAALAIRREHQGSLPPGFEDRCECIACDMARALLAAHVPSSQAARSRPHLPGPSSATDRQREIEGYNDQMTWPRCGWISTAATARSATRGSRRTE